MGAMRQKIGHRERLRVRKKERTREREKKKGEREGGELKNSIQKYRPL